MPSSRNVALALDYVLLVLLLLLFAPRMTGLVIHEYLGIALIVPVILHLLLSWTWIANSLRNFNVNVALNVLLFILVVIAIVSGVMLMDIDDRVWRKLHNLPLNLLEVAIGLHIAMNWRVFLGALKTRVRTAVAFPHAIRRSALIVVAATVIGAGAWGLIGAPDVAREYRQNEFARFRPTAMHGIGQFAGMTLLICGFAYVGRRFLKIRL